MARRVISIWLPHWPIERYRRARPPAFERRGQAGAERPFALVQSQHQGMRLYAVDQAAAGHGLGPGMTLADARAMVPALRVRPADPARDRQALNALAHWAGRYSPWTNRDGDDGLWLDIAGCAHLFGGEYAMAQDLRARLSRAGISARLGIADTPGAAWALARHDGRAIAIAAVGAGLAALNDIPVQGLRLDRDVITLLRRFGLASVGALAAVPRDALARRFSSRQLGQAVLTRLDQLAGRRDEPLSPQAPPPAYRSRQALADPIASAEAIAAVIADLAQALARLLEADAKGARRLTLKAFRVDGSATALPLALAAPTRAADHLTRLLVAKLDQLDPGFGIELMLLEANQTETQPAAQADLAHSADQRAALAPLLDRLALRFGADCLARPVRRQSHLPERAGGLARVEEGAPADDPAAAPPLGQPRPLQLFARPEPVAVTPLCADGPPARLRWRGQDMQVARAQGPERIAPEWWRASLAHDGRPRDYYRIEDARGRRYWLYRHGDGVAARWYMHGLLP